MPAGRASLAAALVACVGWLALVLVASPARGQAPASQPAAAPATNPARLSAGTFTRYLTVDGRDRSYIVHVPPQYDPKKPTPVVLCFHGAFTNAKIVELYSGLDRKADKEGFIVAYPNGTGENPNSLYFNVALPAGGALPDDVKFTSNVIDDLQSAANIDAKRVFATGISNGGMMCYTLAARLSSRIAAIAPVAGVVTLGKSTPQRPVPVIHFHGTADTFVPFNGPTPQMERFIKSVDDSVQIWAKLDGCLPKPTIIDLPDIAHDGTKVHRRVYGPGTDGAEVVLYVIDEGGHTWPNRPGGMKRLLGKTTHNIDADDLMWEFFCKHPMK